MRLNFQQDTVCPTTETLSACPVCEQTRLRALMQVPDFETGTGEYGLVECCHCGLAFTNPRPVEAALPALYAARTTTDFPDARSRAMQRLREYAIDSYLTRQLGSIDLEKLKRVNVLDFGCGDGALSRGVLRHARSRGGTAQVTAVDFHSEVPPSLVGASAMGIRYMSHEEWGDSAEQYDAVFLRHVLEHHPEPRRLLGRLRRMLRPGGRLFIEVPNRRSVWARVFGRYYSGYYVPRHLMHFDTGSLCKAVEKSDLRCVHLGLGHTPLIGRSIAYRTGWNLGNLGAVGLASYPLQVAVDMVWRTSSTIQLTAASDA